MPACGGSRCADRELLFPKTFPGSAPAACDNGAGRSGRSPPGGWRVWGEGSCSRRPANLNAKAQRWKAAKKRADASKFHRMPGGSLNGFSSVDGMSVNGAKLARGPRIILRAAVDDIRRLAPTLERLEPSKTAKNSTPPF